ncbi:MAG: RidA family protein [Gammaproteobacteria bacterium]|nr:MAG: RidA family protein [Gammaproteobacteria bacterium]
MRRSAGSLSRFGFFDTTKPYRGDDVVSIVTYVTTPDGLRDIHEVRTEFFSPPYPVSTLVQVAALVEQDLLIEVTATAIVPEDRYRAPEAIAPDSFDVSDGGGFNIQS